MIRTKKAKKILTKAEQKHLTESAINSMKDLKAQVEFMEEKNVVCFDCKHIARKLGL